MHQYCHMYLIYSCYLAYSAIANADGTLPTLVYSCYLEVYSLYLGYLFYLRYSSTDIRIKTST